MLKFSFSEKSDFSMPPKASRACAAEGSGAGDGDGSGSGSRCGELSSRRKFLRANRFSIIFFCLLLIFSIAVPIFSPYRPEQITAEMLQAPSKAHLLGTDQLGRDILTRLAPASQVSLGIALATAALSSLIGLTAGLCAAYFGGKIDEVITRISEIFLAFPDVMLVLLVVSVIGSGIGKLILLLAFTSWPETAKVVRGSAISVKEEGYVKFAEQALYPKHAIIFKHIFPNISGVFFLTVVNRVASAVISEASLSFLGMGVAEPQASWGNILTEAQSLTVLLEAPWVWLPPSILLFLTVLSIHKIGESLKAMHS